MNYYKLKKRMMDWEAGRIFPEDMIPSKLLGETRKKIYSNGIAEYIFQIYKEWEEVTKEEYEKQKNISTKYKNKDFDLYDPNTWVKEKECEQYLCKSYYDDDRGLQDCTCGKCGENKTEIRKQIEESENELLRQESIKNAWIPKKGEEFWCWNFAGAAITHIEITKKEDFFIILDRIYIGACHPTKELCEDWGKRYSKAFESILNKV